ncbi:MAG: insulinase family protein [Muribaculaceae bacterium]|nr:insulinase family protein [Muribaculaceae bacterium]
MTVTTDGVTTARGPHGLLMVHRPVDGVSEYCGVTAGVGSRDEHSPERYGLAHFVEHTIFKGTSRRTDTYIINRMEAVGGELNAFTTKEETTVYAAMPAGNYRRATALIAELVTESTFPTRKIDREREVIADEIDSYLDSPADGVFDLYDEMMWAGNSMAHNILGTKESVDGIDSAMCRDFLCRHFTADNMVYF